MFKDVKPIDAFGEGGVPAPLYFGMFKGEMIHAWAKGQARDAVAWLKDRTHDFAVYAKIDGEMKLITRGRA